MGGSAPPHRQTPSEIDSWGSVDPVAVLAGTPVIADRGHDSDALRDEWEAAGYDPVIAHRSNRVKPSRNDGRRRRRYGHRWLIERTNAWIHDSRGLAGRWTHSSFPSVGRADLGFIPMTLQRFRNSL